MPEAPRFRLPILDPLSGLAEWFSRGDPLACDPRRFSVAGPADLLDPAGNRSFRRTRLPVG